METVFQNIDNAILKLMRNTVHVSLVALVAIAAIAWPAAANLGLPLYAVGFACCAASAIWGRRTLVAFGRAMIPNILTKFRRAPDAARRRVIALIDGKNQVPIGVHMPLKDDGKFVLGIIEDADRGDIMISESTLKCSDDVLKIMLGHELGHLHDPPERSAPRNDLLLFGWCVFLASQGASLWMLAAAYVLRLALVGFVRLTECWIREVRADIHGFHLFNGSQHSERFFQQLETLDAVTRLHKVKSPMDKKDRPSVVPALAVLTIIVLFPHFAAFAFIELVSLVLFALMPTTHPPTAQRRELALKFLKDAA